MNRKTSVSLETYNQFESNLRKYNGLRYLTRLTCFFSSLLMGAVQDAPFHSFHMAMLGDVRAGFRRPRSLAIAPVAQGAGDRAQHCPVLDRVALVLVQVGAPPGLRAGPVQPGIPAGLQRAQRLLWQRLLRIAMSAALRCNRWKTFTKVNQHLPAFHTGRIII